MTEQEEQHSLERRIEHLESRVRELERELGAGNKSERAAHSSGRKPADRRTLADRMGSAMQPGEEWLNRIGIGLLLLGLAFLFKYTIDQGWIVPPVRSAVGLAAGAALLVSGFRLDKRSALRQLLLGGGIAAFFLTGFATSYLYDFVPDFWMWAFMIGVTLGALILALSQGEAALSAVGMAGGFGTPFMLQDGSAGIPVLILYTLLLLAASSVIYRIKGWRSMLWIPAAGTWFVLFSTAGYVTGLFEADSESVRYYLQAGTAAAFAALWAVPLWHELDDSEVPVTEEGSSLPANTASLRLHMAGYVILIPLLTFNYGTVIWDLSSQGWGVAAVLLAGLFAGISHRLRIRERRTLASFHAFAALLLLAESAFLLLDDPWVFVALTAEAVTLRYFAHRLKDDLVRLGSHLIFLLLLFWILTGLSGDITGTIPFLGPDALVRLAVIAAGGLLVPFWQRRRKARLFYRGLAHLLLLAWLYHESMGLENGQAFASLSWGIYTAVLLVVGFARGTSWLRVGAMATVFLLVAKLLLFDLSQLPAIWRILLFMGLGSAFLMIGYYWQTKWRKE